MNFTAANRQGDPIAQQALARGAEMLSALLRQPVWIEGAASDGYGCAPETDAGQARQLGVFIGISGDIQGALLFVLNEAEVCWLLEPLLGPITIPELLSEPASSTIREVGNIFASGFLASLEEQLKVRALPAPPQLETGTLEQLLRRYRREDRVVGLTLCNKTSDKPVQLATSLFLSSASRQRLFRRDR